jgi:hypothetical protein
MNLYLFDRESFKYLRQMVIFVHKHLYCLQSKRKNICKIYNDYYFHAIVK